MALPLLLFLLLSLTLLAHGTLLLALQEHRASRAFLHATRAGLAARSALVQSLDSLPLLSPPDPEGLPVPVQRRDLGDGLERALRMRWLSTELFLLEAEGRSRGWPGARTVAGVGWRMDPFSRMRAFSAGMEVGVEVLASDPSQLSSGGFLDPPLGWKSSDCESYQTDLDLLFPSETIRTTAPLSETPVPVEGDGRIPGLGLLTGDRLLRLGEGGDGAGPEWPGSAPGSGCPGSGDPRILISPESVTLTGGQWCGLLVVRGDLRLEDEGRFQGLLLVGGTVTVGPGWLIQGMGRVGGSLRLSGGGRVEVAACPAFRVLEEVAVLRVPFLLPEASEIGLW